MTVLPVLLYYRVQSQVCNHLSVPLTTFEEHMRILKEQGFHSISCRQLCEHLHTRSKLPENPVLITFDQGHINHYRYTQDILFKYNFSGTFFIVGEWLLKNLYEVPGFEEYMHLEHLRHLQDAGNEIALQGYGHLNYKHATLNAIREDIHENISFFKEVDLPFTRCFAYPLGARPAWLKRQILHDIFWKEKIELVFEIGNEVNNLSAFNRFAISRILIKGTDSVETFAGKLAGMSRMR